MKKCYYARPVNLYGTKIGEQDIALINQLGFEVFDPCDPVYNLTELYKEKGMEVFYHVIKKHCQALAFRPCPDGLITAGVMGEIKIACQYGIPVFEIPSGFKRRTMSLEWTEEYLRDVGAR